MKNFHLKIFIHYPMYTFTYISFHSSSQLCCCGFFFRQAKNSSISSSTTINMNFYAGCGLDAQLENCEIVKCLQQIPTHCDRSANIYFANKNNKVTFFLYLFCATISDVRWTIRNKARHREKKKKKNAETCINNIHEMVNWDIIIWMFRYIISRARKVFVFIFFFWFWFCGRSIHSRLEGVIALLFCFCFS